MTVEPIDHYTYIIRVWKEPASQSAEAQWRFVLVDADSQHREGFVVVERLLVALQTELMKITENSQS